MANEVKRNNRFSADCLGRCLCGGGRWMQAQTNKENQQNQHIMYDDVPNKNNAPDLLF